MRIEGLDALQARLRTAAKFEDVKNAVKLNGSELQKTMHRNASFVKGYQTGTTKRSIKLVLTRGGLVATVAPTTEYSPYLIYGTRFMMSQDFFTPAYHSQKTMFLRDLMRLVE